MWFPIVLRQTVVKKLSWGRKNKTEFSAPFILHQPSTILTLFLQEMGGGELDVAPGHQKGARYWFK